MQSAIEEYYATNYSNCNLTYSFLASWQSISYTSHVIQLVALPLQILALYVIIYKTPIAMKISKIPLLINHSLCVILDFVFCTLCTLYIFVPMYAMSGIGVLAWIGVPTLLQVIIFFVAMLCATFSYIYLFESRASSLLNNRFRITNNRSRIVYNCVILIPVLFALPFLFFFRRDQDAAKLDALKNYPCPTREFFTTSVFIALTDKTLMSYVLVPFLMGVSSVVGHFLFQMGCLVYYIYIVPSRSVSRETREKQKTFLISILFQTSVPFFVAIPAATVLFLYLYGYYSQKVMNSVICFIQNHGIVESICLICVHKPYRNAIAIKIKSLKCARARNVIPVERLDGNLTRESGNGDDV
ncbi:Serpentine Receptor, class H [Caenorhabditis elegans]|uniref:Serpentine Receptor, class H n=1 Tax=Caenorhabditis elegans TaxID=6239 RepID=Q9XX73_CAEEL|nr:Serpentine Receptor, class H [Caenorhabditis elegans]CAA20962.2 Serpentine Receptor, class H [Caenorhabditis elegans]|eukprot:NP_507292.2 Serpentine Receptor, class H [Caenorhabditis elegans]